MTLLMNLLEKKFKFNFVEKTFFLLENKFNENFLTTQKTQKKKGKLGKWQRCSEDKMFHGKMAFYTHRA